MPGTTRAERIAWAGAALFLAAQLWFLYSYLVRFDRLEPRLRIVAALTADAALFSMFALHHSVFARTGLKRRIAGLVPPGLERSAYTWIASGLFIVTCTAWQHVPGLAYSLRGPWALAGYAIQLAGLVLTVRASARLDVLDLAGVRQAQRARTGVARDRAALETTGLYGLVRHPLYFAWALLVFGAPHMTATRLTFAVISTAYLALAIPWEERSLVRTYGLEYEAYRRQVRWRMVPFLY